MNHFIIIPVVFSSLLLRTAEAALDVHEAVAVALAHNPELQVARERIEAATGQAIQARLWTNPELELSAEDVPVDGGGLSHSQNLIGISQTIPFPGKKPLAHRAARHAVRASEWDYRTKEIALIRDVKIAFHRVLAAERRLALATGLVELGESLVDSARNRVEAGAGSAQEGLRAEIDLESLRISLSGIESELQESRQNLAELLGRLDLQDAKIRGDLANTPLRGLLGSLDAEALFHHPRREAAVADADRAAAQLRGARLSPFPDVTLGVAGGRNQASGERLMEFRVSLPLPVIDRGQGRTREARANAAMAQAQIALAEQRLWREAQSAQARLRAAARQVAAYRERILPKARQALALTTSGFNEGKFGFLDVLDTQRTAAQARLTYTEKLLELNVAQSELQALLLQKELAKQNPNQPIK